MNDVTANHDRVLRRGLIATVLTPVVVIVYLSLIGNVSGWGFLGMTGIAIVFTIASLFLSGWAIRKSTRRRLWLWFNVAVSVGFLVVLGILLLNTAVLLL